MRTAQTLYSGIFAEGSKARLVRKFAAESRSFTKGHEYLAFPHRLRQRSPTLQLTPPRLHPHLFPVSDPRSFGVPGVDGYLKVRGPCHQPFHPPGHGAAVPVVQHPAGVEDQREPAVGHLRCRCRLLHGHELAETPREAVLIEDWVCRGGRGWGRATGCRPQRPASRMICPKLSA